MSNVCELSKYQDNRPPSPYSVALTLILPPPGTCMPEKATPLEKNPKCSSESIYDHVQVYVCMTLWTMLNATQSALGFTSVSLAVSLHALCHTSRE